jgi:hypothetical protein
VPVFISKERKVKAIIVLLLIPIVIVLVSCSSENPIGPVINQTWGTLNYFSYEVHDNWKYRVIYPNLGDTLELWYYIFGTEYIAPYEGYQRAILVNEIPTGYYYLDALQRNALYNFNPDISKWVLFYKLPFINDNSWESETNYRDFQNDEWKITLEVDVLQRESVSVIAGDFEDCVKIFRRETHIPIDTTAGDSTLYYEEERWFAPDVGLIKWRMIDTNDEDLRNAVVELKRAYHERYTGTSSFLQSESELVFSDWSNMVR